MLYELLALRRPFEGEGRVYFTMKLVKGESLADIFEKVKTGEEAGNELPISTRRGTPTKRPGPARWGAPSRRR